MTASTLTKPHDFVQLSVETFDHLYNGIEKKLAVKLYSKIAQLFLNDIENRMRTLSSSISNQNSSDTVQQAHKIKGSLLALGGNLLAVKFRNMEINAPKMNREELEIILNSSEHDLTVFRTELILWNEFLLESVK